MVNYVKCIVCGKEFKDTHPKRKGNKYCCREHFNKYKKENGTWNKGKKWEEIYDPETLVKLKEHVTRHGKDHFNYDTKRKDTSRRNVLYNNRYSKEKELEIQKLIMAKGEIKAAAYLLKKVSVDKRYYQRACFNYYKRICLKCGAENKYTQIGVHHIDKNRKNTYLSNLIPLCNKCHKHLENDILQCRELQAKYVERHK